MKFLFKKSMIAFVVSAMLCLTACSHKNPIETQPEEEVIAFLKKASSYAEKQTGRQRTVGVMYQVCHKYKQDDPKTCPSIYRYIVKYSHTSEGIFSTITIEDLESKEAFKRLEPYYR